MLQTLLGHARSVGVSDVHLRQGCAPWWRLHGQLQRCVVPDDLHAWAAHAQAPWLTAFLESLPSLQAAWQQGAEVDAALHWPQAGRWRLHLFRVAQGCAAALRHLPDCPPALGDLPCATVLARWSELPRGLVLCTGPTGSGKSSTLAAMVAHRAQQGGQHILTVEDPIEFLHTSAHSLVSQREVGAHTAGFAPAVRAALREDPDLILLGELRDTDTIRLALRAAETGHLVLATLHTRGAAAAIHRLIDAFEPAEKDSISAQLADSLQGVVAQSLCLRADGRGRVPAMEVLEVTPAARHLIRERRVAQLHSVMQSGRAFGMQTLEQALAHWVTTGTISRAEALRHIPHLETSP